MKKQKWTSIILYSHDTWTRTRNVYLDSLTAHLLNRVCFSFTVTWLVLSEDRRRRNCLSNFLTKFGYSAIRMSDDDRDIDIESDVNRIFCAKYCCEKYCSELTYPLFSRMARIRTPGYGIPTTRNIFLRWASRSIILVTVIEFMKSCVPRFSSRDSSYWIFLHFNQRIWWY